MVYNTKEVLDKIVPYFSFLYCAKQKKRSDLAKLHRIFDLSKALTGKGRTLDVALASELIHLVYSTNPKGQERKITLTEKLSILNCSREDPAFRDEIAVVPENVDLPSKFFIIGLFLGDGSIGFVFDEPKSRAPKFYIKILFNFASQLANDSNIYLLTLIAKSMGLAPNIKKVSMVTLDYSGETVFKEILPFLEEHREWLY